MPLKVSPSPKPSNILKTYSLTEDVFLILNISVVSEEPVKPQSSEKPSVDGPKNQSELSSD